MTDPQAQPVPARKRHKWHDCSRHNPGCSVHNDPERLKCNCGLWPKEAQPKPHDCPCDVHGCVATVDALRSTLARLQNPDEKILRPARNALVDENSLAAAIKAAAQAAQKEQR